MRQEKTVYGAKGNAGTFEQERLSHCCKEKNQVKCFKHTTKFIILLISAIFILSNANPILFGVNIKFLKKIEISQEGEPLLKPKAFCLTDDGIFIITDYGAGNIKIYEEVVEDNRELLRQVKIEGRKGYGEGEFSKPSFCFYDKNESKFGVVDFGIRKIFIYDRMGRIDFTRVKEISCWKPGSDIKLIGNRLFISGYLPDPDGKPYDFYYIDLKKDQKIFLLPAYLKYGLNSFQEYEIQYREKSDISVIGINGFFDIYRDDAYFVWEGNLKVIKLNFVSGDIDQVHFGMQPPHYVKPYASEKLIDSRRKRDIKMHESERMKMSYVKNIFTSSKYVLVIYEGPVNQGTATNFWLQLYTLDGDFIKEVPIQGQIDNKMWFDKDKHILYSLSGKLVEDVDHYFVLKYAIHE
jgi:hypothetical protein